MTYKERRTNLNGVKDFWLSNEQEEEENNDNNDIVVTEQRQTRSATEELAWILP